MRMAGLMCCRAATVVWDRERDRARQTFGYVKAQFGVAQTAAQMKPKGVEHAGRNRMERQLPSGSCRFCQTTSRAPGLLPHGWGTSSVRGKLASDAAQVPAHVASRAGERDQVQQRAPDSKIGQPFTDPISKVGVPRVWRTVTFPIRVAASAIADGAVFSAWDRFARSGTE